MSLKKKIALSFFISAFIIAILGAFEYVSFIEIKKEIRYLEITDTISRKSLQLRRHEKNFFLYSPQKGEEESAAVHSYIRELRDILTRGRIADRAGTVSLPALIDDYEKRFEKIEAAVRNISVEFAKTKASNAHYAAFFPLIESTFLERPLQITALLKRTFFLPSSHVLISSLRELDTDITALRKNGEDILIASKELDKRARDNAESTIHLSQIAILVFFPIFFAVGIGMLFFISTNVVKRLMLLINVVEKTGAGSYPHLAVLPSRGAHPDEVGLLIEKFNNMEDQLEHRETELARKNRELMQTKKLAAIGTLASGVAHELNNPLNNIYLSAQVLAKEAGESCPVPIRDAVSDIVGQTARVKRIVGDLLEFARGREPQFREVDLHGLITSSYKHLAVSQNVAKIRFSLNPESAKIIMQADPAQLEQVFINLFTNAVDAMSGNGDITVTVKEEERSIVIKISDSGKGIPRESLDKIFEPFFTTRDKGTGLGLAIVFNIIKKHNGDIRAESEEGKGTTFTITLPRQGK